MTTIPKNAFLTRFPALFLAAIFALTGTASAADPQADPIFDSSVYLLRSSLVMDRKGQFSVLLRSLRQMRDPELRPFYKELMLSESRIMRIHGILGMAEADPSRQIDLKHLADVKDGNMQSELLGAALDSELMNVANAKQVLAWPGTEIEAKVVIATHLLEKKEFNDVAILKKAAETPNLARKGIVALLLVQLGDPVGTGMLEGIDKSTDSVRDDVRSLILQTAFRFKFDRITPWAVKVSTEPGVNEKLGLLAMRTAIRFGDKGSMGVWTQQYNSVTDVADKMRLAISLLNLASFIEPASFDVLIASADPLVKQMGMAGKAVSAKTNVGEEIGKLIAMDYPVANAWAIGYATFHGTPEESRRILTDLVLSYERGPARNKAQRLDEAMAGAQFLCEKDTAAAIEVLKPILNRETTDKQLVQGILVGLIRASKGEPHKVVADLTRTYEDANSNALRLLLLAKHDVALKPQELKDLGLLVRGGGSAPDALRLQAAWLYLKQTKQTAKALELAMKR